MALSTTNLSKWQSELDSDLAYQLATSTLQSFNADDLLSNKVSIPHVFSDVITPEGSPITNQKSSGRCWLFASLNQYRIPIANKLQLKEFQLSQNYLFFYDKLEKANYFLDKILETYKEEVGSRLIQSLLIAPVLDGGQFTMFVNLVEKYGVVPIDVYPDVYSSTASRKLNDLVTAKLREAAEVLRDLKTAGKVDEAVEKKEEYVKEIYKYLTIFLGAPPKPDSNFVYEYYDKDKKYQKLITSPLKFFQDYADYKPAVSLINDPRNPYNTKIKIEHLNNMSGVDREVEYLNLTNEQLSQYIVNRIKSNKPVFFGSHTPKYMHKKKGIIDIQRFGYNLIGYNQNQTKRSRVLYGESLMTHAMLITGVNINDQGKPDRYRVENSWGKDSGKDGYYVMSQEYFEEYCFQIVVEEEDLEEDVKTLLKKEAIVLPLWDPMGALAD